MADPGARQNYIEVTLDDIETANRLCHQVLGRSLDEIAPQTRRLLKQIDEMVTGECRKLEMDRCDFRFTRREVREYSRIGDTRLKIHLHRLEELEYLIVHQGGRGRQFVYELAYDDNCREGEPFMPRLINVSKLKKREYDANPSPQIENLSPTGRPQVAPKSPPCRPPGGPVSLNDLEAVQPINGKSLKNAHLDESKKQLIVDAIEESY